MSRKDEDSGLGLLGILALGGVFAWLRHETKKNQEEIVRHEAEEKRRKSSLCTFKEGISETEFTALALRIAKKIKRIKSISVSGPFICGEVESQSGISTWKFTVDFNDYGKITGRYWIKTENKDSTIPNRIGDMISNQLLQIINKDNNIHKNIDDGIDKSNAEMNTSTPLKPKKKRNNFISFTLLFLLGCMVFPIYKQWEYSKMIIVGAEASSLNNQDYSSVYKILNEAGFSNISLNEISDLTYSQIEKEGLVINVSIEGRDSFVSNDRFPRDSKIIISYHGLKLVSAPLVNKEAKGLNYIDIQKSFVDAGFVNITLEPIQDIVFGWFVKTGEVDSILIAGEKNYNTSDQYRPDIEVIIKYHIPKSN